MVSETDLGTKDQQIDNFFLQYKKLSDEKLWKIIDKWGNDSPRSECIAAWRVLRERSSTNEALKHAELLTEIKRPHWSVTPLFWISVIAALATCVAAYYSIELKGSGS